VPGGLKKSWKAIAGTMLLSTAMAAQISVGDNVSLSSNATVLAGYTDNWGNQIQSSHGLNFGLAGSVTGYYYSPNFLSFTVDPYFNQSRANSNSASLTNASGVTASSAIFAGSHFPGSVRYTKAFNSTGNFNIPGLPDYTTSGNNQSFGVNWSELMPDYPTLTAGFISGSSNYSIFGTNQDGRTNFRDFYVNSSYNLAGFSLGGGFGAGSGSSTIPGAIVGQPEVSTDSNNKNLSVSASHPLPWAGSFTTTYTRNWVNSDYVGYKFNGTIDTVIGNVGFHPLEKLSWSTTADYTDNLNGLVYLGTVPTTGPSNTAPGNPQAGTPGTVGTTQSSTTSNAYDVGTVVTYSFAPNLIGLGQFQYRNQNYQGVQYSSFNYGGGATYSRKIVGGGFGAGAFLNGNHVTQTGADTLGLSANLSYNRNIGLWNFGSNFLYNQNSQTLLVTDLSSSYSFSGNVGRHIGHSAFWNAGAGLYRTGFVVQPGTDSQGESFTMNFGFNRFGFGGGYAQARGTSVVGSNGITPTPPLPGEIPPNLLVNYGGHSYSFSASANPVRRMSITASYSNTRSNTANQGINSANNQQLFATYAQYQFRQLNFYVGYTRLNQGFSASGLPPENVNSFSIGISRWLNIF
jgi:hypothetical protein